MKPFISTLTFALALFVFNPLVFPAQSQDAYISTSESRESLSITVYNSNLGLVKEIRRLESPPMGLMTLKFMDVASQIQPETVLIRSLYDSDSLSVLEQNYEYDLLSPQKMLDKYIGRTIKVYRWNEKTGRDEEYSAEVLSTHGGTILKIGDDITFNYPGRLAFPEVPDNLIAKPTLVWLVNNQESNQKIEVTYLTTGMTWKADYVLVINDKATRGDIKGWVTLNNTSGATYEDAKLKLVAGDVHRAPQVRRNMSRSAGISSLYEKAEQMTEESFFEYHLYTLNRLTTLKDNSQKQVSLLEAANIKVDKHLIFYGSSYYYRGQYGKIQNNQKIGVYLDIPNKKDYGMGMPLPKGIVRVYKADSEGSLQFIGEDRIDHTPKDEKVRIKLGESFDVVGERTQTDYKIISHCVTETAWEVSLRNHKEEAVEVELYEPVGGEWKITENSHAFVKEDAHTFSFRVTVPKDGETKVTYRVRSRWCR